MRLSVSHWYPGSGVLLDLSIPDLCPLSYFYNSVHVRSNVLFMSKSNPTIIFEPVSSKMYKLFV